MQNDDLNGTEAVLVSNIPREEKTILGFMTTKQLEIVGVGVGVGFLAFIFTKFILGLIGIGTITCWLVALFIWILLVAPFAFIAFKNVKSEGVNPVVLYPYYVQRQIDKRSVDEYGTYINYHINHFDVTHGEGVFIENEGTQIPPEYQDDK